MKIISVFIDSYQNQAWFIVMATVVNTDTFAFGIAENLLKHFLAERLSVNAGGWIRKFLLVCLNTGAHFAYFKLPAGAVKWEWVC